MTVRKSILMVAAENDALPNAKVGGIGDVVRDIPLALQHEGCSVQVVLPDYGYFAALPGSQRVGEFAVQFGGKQEEVHLYRVKPKIAVSERAHAQHPPIQYWALGHSYFSPAGMALCIVTIAVNAPLPPMPANTPFFARL